MKIGLPFLTQLRGAPPSDPTRTTAQDGTPVTTNADGQRNTTGGWTALTLQQMVAGILAGYHTQHNDDDTHATITATGPISERGRSTALGAWLAAPYVAGNFAASGSAHWTVLPANLFTFAYTLIGTTLLVTWAIDGSALSVATAGHLTIAIPGHVTAARFQLGTFGYDDNGTRGTGVAVVRSTSGGAVIELYKDIRAAAVWSLSGNLAVFGQMAFDVNGS